MGLLHPSLFVRSIVLSIAVLLDHSLPRSAKACMQDSFPPTCWDDDFCICRSRLALRQSTICIASTCSASEQRGFLDGIGIVCGARESASLARAAATVVVSSSGEASPSSTVASSPASSSTTTISRSTVLDMSSSLTTNTTATASSAATSSRITTSAVSRRPLTTTITDDENAPSTVISTIQPPPTANTLASSSTANNDDSSSSLSAGAIAGIGIAILVALLLVGLCAWHTRRTLAGRTGAAKDYCRKSQQEGGAFNVVGSSGGGGLSEKEKQQQEKAGQRMSRKIPMNGEFWENVKRQSQVYNLPEPQNPFAPRVGPLSGRLSAAAAGGASSGDGYGYPLETERPVQTYMLPSQFYASSASHTITSSVGGSPSFAQRQSSLPLPLPGAAAGGLASTSLISSGTSTPPTLPAKDRFSFSQYATVPTSPLKPLILPSLHNGPPPAPIAGTAVCAGSTAPARLLQQQHRRSGSIRSGTGVLPSSPPLVGLEEHADDLLRRSRSRIRSASIAAAKVPLPPSRASSVQSSSGADSPASVTSPRMQSSSLVRPIEPINEREDESKPQEKGEVVQQPKSSFEGLAYLR